MKAISNANFLTLSNMKKKLRQKSGSPVTVTFLNQTEGKKTNKKRWNHSILRKEMMEWNCNFPFPKLNTCVILDLRISLQLIRCDHTLETCCAKQIDMKHGSDTRYVIWNKGGDDYLS